MSFTQQAQIIHSQPKSHEKKELKELKESLHKKSKQINDLSNQLFSSFNDILNNITLLSNKTVELFEQNEELQNQIESNKQNNKKNFVGSSIFIRKMIEDGKTHIQN